MSENAIDLKSPRKKMKVWKKIILIVSGCLFIIFTINKINSKDYINYQFIKAELDLFTVMAKEQSLDSGRYQIYTLNICKNDSGIFLTAEYIDQLPSIKQLQNCNYYFELNNQLFLLRLANPIEEEVELRNFDLKKLNDLNLVTEKLKGSTNSTAKHIGAIYYYKKGIYFKRIFDNDSLIPKNMSIFIR